MPQSRFALIGLLAIALSSCASIADTPPTPTPQLVQNQATDTPRLPALATQQTRAADEKIATGNIASLPEHGEKKRPGFYTVGDVLDSGIYVIFGDPNYECVWKRYPEPSPDAKPSSISPHLGIAYAEINADVDKGFYSECPFAKVTKFPPTDGKKLERVDVPGTYLVGVDIVPGRYRFMPTPGQECIAMTLSGFRGLDDPSSVIEVATPVKGASSVFYLPVSSQSTALYSACAFERVSDAEERRRPRPYTQPGSPDSALTTLGSVLTPGSYEVRRIGPGLYKGNAANNPGAVCSWEIVNNDGEVQATYSTASGPFYAEILESDKAFNLKGCFMVKVEDPSKIRPVGRLVPPGQYIVGAEVQTGRYRVETGVSLRDQCVVSVYNAARFNPSGNTRPLIARAYVFKYGEFFFDLTEEGKFLWSDCLIERME